MLKFAVIWHEINSSGVPTNVMGMSELFDSCEKAKAWIDGAIFEDDVRSQSERHVSLDVDPAIGHGVRRTIGNGQTTYYFIQKMDVDDGEKTRERLREATDAIGNIESYVKLLGEEHSVRRDILRIIKKYRNPLKEFEVQVVFSPATVMKVTARTAKEAQNIVNSQVDNGTLVLSDRQKLDIMNDILENIESIKTLGETAE